MRIAARQFYTCNVTKCSRFYVNFESWLDRRAAHREKDLTFETRDGTEDCSSRLSLEQENAKDKGELKILVVNYALNCTKFVVINVAETAAAVTVACNGSGSTETFSIAQVTEFLSKVDNTTMNLSHGISTTTGKHDEKRTYDDEIDSDEGIDGKGELEQFLMQYLEVFINVS